MSGTPVSQPAPAPQAQVMAPLPGFSALFSSAWALSKAKMGLYVSIILEPIILCAILAGLAYSMSSVLIGGIAYVVFLVLMVTMAVAMIHAMINPETSSLISAYSFGLKKFFPKKDSLLFL